MAVLDAACPIIAPEPFCNQASANIIMPHQQMYNLLSSAFAHFSEVCDSAIQDADGARKTIINLEEQWGAAGMCGPHMLEALGSFRQLIAWEKMVPDTFNKFYRFVFHVVKLPRKKHVPVDAALGIWRLLLHGRFRLLDKWCDFMSSSQQNIKVISEDQWRQVLDFSRCVHEDLSNYDPNGAWSCFLDEFVEYLRSLRPGSRSRSHMASEDGAGLNHSLCSVSSLPDMDLQTCGSGAMMMQTSMIISPRCGSKRRSPDVDVVVERLSAFPLPSSQEQSAPDCSTPPADSAMAMSQSQDQQAQQQYSMLQCDLSPCHQQPLNANMNLSYLNNSAHMPGMIFNSNMEPSSPYGQQLLVHALHRNDVNPGTATKRQCTPGSRLADSIVPTTSHSGLALQYSSHAPGSPSAHTQQQPSSSPLAHAHSGSPLPAGLLKGSPRHASGVLGAAHSGALPLELQGLHVQLPGQGSIELGVLHANVPGQQQLAGIQPQPLGFSFEVPMVQTHGNRRHLKPRRSNVSELLHHTVSDALFHE